MKGKILIKQARKAKIELICSHIQGILFLFLFDSVFSCLTVSHNSTVFAKTKAPTMTVDHCTPVAFSYTAKGIVYLIAIIMTITIIFTLYKTVTYKHSDGTSRTGFSFWCAVPFQVFTISYLTYLLKKQ